MCWLIYSQHGLGAFFFKIHGIVFFLKDRKSRNGETRTLKCYEKKREKVARSIKETTKPTTTKSINNDYKHTYNTDFDRHPFSRSRTHTKFVRNSAKFKKKVKEKKERGREKKCIAHFVILLGGMNDTMPYYVCVCVCVYVFLFISFDIGCSLVRNAFTSYVILRRK